MAYMIDAFIFEIVKLPYYKYKNILILTWYELSIAFVQCIKQLF